MAEKRTGRKCVFCGAAGKMHHEHVFADWIQRLLGDLGKGTHIRTRPDEENVWQDTAFKRKVGCVCQPCNNHWMNDLENEVKPWLTPTLLGKDRQTYDEAAQTPLGPRHGSGWGRSPTGRT
jgi:hypothetical protein